MSRIIFIALIILVIVSAVLALRIGGGSISWSDFFYALFHPETRDPNGMIIWVHRFPRILAALLIGAGLGSSGCVLQGLLRNPLAEPYTLGIAGGSMLGVAIATISISALLGVWTLPLAAFLGALLAVGLIYLIASLHHFSVIGLVLSGVILSFIFSSIVLLIFTLAQPNEVKSILFWMMGNLSGLRIELINIIPFLIIPGIVLSCVFGRELDALSLGDEKAVYLGVSAGSVRRLLFVITSLVVGACIATAGMIGFVGLIIPHIMRLAIGPKHKPLIMASALAGASFLVICDTLARTVLASYGQELPVGVITGIVGGLFFIIFLLRKNIL